MPERMKQGWQQYIQAGIYPRILKLSSADFMHTNFLMAADHELLPSSGPLDTQAVALKGRGISFPSAVGLSSGLLTDGRGIDAIMETSGFDASTGLSTFVELGTCTPDKQVSRNLKQQSGGHHSLRINFEGDKV